MSHYLGHIEHFDILVILKYLIKMMKMTVMLYDIQYMLYGNIT